MGARGDQSCRSARVMWPISGADVCSRQATRPVLMRLIRGPPKAALPRGQDGLHPGCASFPWHTSAPVEVSDSALIGALLSHAPCEAVCRLLVFTGGWPSQAHSSSSDGKLCSMSRKGDGRLCSRQILEQLGGPGVGLAQAAPDHAGDDGVGEDRGHRRPAPAGSGCSSSEVLVGGSAGGQFTRRLILVGLEGLEPPTRPL